MTETDMVVIEHCLRYVLRTLSPAEIAKLFRRYKWIDKKQITHTLRHYMDTNPTLQALDAILEELKQERRNKL